MSAVREDLASALLPRELIQALDAAVERLDHDQLVWSSGYLAGLAASRSSTAARALPEEQAEPREQSQSAAGAEPSEPWLVMYATETGNSRRVAQALEAQLREAGLAAELVDLRDYDPKALKRCRRATFVLATHGLGDPAEGTEQFFSFWMGKRAPRLEQLQYSVLALGDSSYEEFCGIGREFDARLEALGARRLHERVDCDVDFDAPARQWRDGVVARIKETIRPKPRAGGATITLVEPLALGARSEPLAPGARAEPTERPAVTRDRPFAAEILVNQKITGRGSTKDVRHIELSLEGSGSSYLPGDAIGVWPENTPALVGALLELLELDGERAVELGGESLSLRDALTCRLEITKLSRGFVQAYADAAGNAELCALLASNDALARYVAPRQIVDVVAEHPGRIEAQQLVDALRKLTPRLYSAASSPDANEGEAHLTVGVVAYRKFGRLHWGAASGFIAEAKERVSIYVEPNDRFRLPADSALPIIMIGAGTGVAPYRAFVQHRREHGARGENWLIYGDRNMRSDFLYQIEWLRHLRDGTLNRMTVAFSRDQERKIYVQHRIAEEAREIYAWLERGAHVYVCGEAENMAPAVHAALRGAIQSAGGRTREAAEAYLQELKVSRRYQRDVY